MLRNINSKYEIDKGSKNLCRNLKILLKKNFLLLDFIKVQVMIKNNCMGV